MTGDRLARLGGLELSPGSSPKSRQSLVSKNLSNVTLPCLAKTGSPHPLPLPGASLPEEKGTPRFLTPSGIFSGVRPTSLSSSAFLSPRPSAQASLPSLTWTPASTCESFSQILWDAHSLAWTVASRGCCVSLVNPWLCLVWGRVPHVYH